MGTVNIAKRKEKLSDGSICYNVEIFDDLNSFTLACTDENAAAKLIRDMQESFLRYTIDQIHIH